MLRRSQGWPSASKIRQEPHSRERPFISLQIHRYNPFSVLPRNLQGIYYHASFCQVVRLLEVRQIFGDLDEARAYQELIVRRTTHLLGETYARIMAAKMDLGHAPTADIPGEIIDPCYTPTMLFPERDACIADLGRWCQAFRPILGQLLASSNPKTAVGASMVMIEAMNAEIALAGAFFTEECSHDACKETIFLSRIVSQREDEIVSKDVPSFSVLLETLYDAANTCRDPVFAKELYRCFGLKLSKTRRSTKLDSSLMQAV
jgi:hypothetical protein